jgi:hypothetical protein
MTQIDVTSLVLEDDAYAYSASAAEMGQDAGRITWRNALQRANDALLATEEELDALRDWARGSGGWTCDEIEAWSDAECNALFIQIVSGDWRELEDLASDDNGEIDWEEVERLANEGTIGGSLYRGDDGRIWYYLGL